MVEVMPFRAWRYDSASVGSLNEVTAPPYDVINPEEQNELYELHPCNVVRLILNREEPGDESSTAPYERAANFLRHWKREGVLHQDREDAIYVYHQEFEWEGTTFCRRGFLASLKLESIGTGNVYPHEQTMPGPKADRLALMQHTQMNLSPIFGLFPDDIGEVQEALEVVARKTTPVEIRDEQNVLHRLWVIEDRDAISQARELMQNRPVYIADGHHRYETACNYRDLQKENGTLKDGDAAENVMMMFVGMDDPGLAILPTHRIFSGFGKLSSDDFRSLLEPYFDCQTIEVEPTKMEIDEVWETLETDASSSILAIGVPGSSEWIIARLKEDSKIMAEIASEHSTQWHELGVSLLHRLVVEHLLKEQKNEEDFSWQYVHKISEVQEAMVQGKASFACLVPAATMEDVQLIAQERETMPPKSTFFYPKLLTGLVFNDLS